MIRLLFLLPVGYLAVMATLAGTAASRDLSATYFGLAVGGTIALTAGVVIFIAVREKVSVLRTNAFLGAPLPEPPRVRLDAAAEAVLALSRDDPHFTAARVQAHVDALYLAMQHAGRDGRLADVHPWMSDGLFQRLSTQVRLLGAVTGGELLQGHALRSAVIAGAQLGETYQALSVRVTVAPLDEDRGPHAAQTQTWLFLRRLAVTTQAHGLVDGRCPNCGAPLRLTATQRCAHCQAVVNSGQHDWVLCDVSPGATTLTRRGELLDVSGLRASDPSLSTEELTDRAVLAFWRWYEALATGDARRLTRITTDGFRDELAAALEARAMAGVRVTVGGAEVRMLRHRQGLEEASVLVWWSSGDGAAQQTVLRLVRPTERRAPAGTGLASLRCEGCLAPMTDAETPGCEYCGRPFTDAWRLDGIASFASWIDEVRVLRHQVGPRAGGWQAVPRHERLRALQLAVAVVQADGQVSDAEHALLGHLTAEWGLEPAELAAALAGEGPVSGAGLALPRDFARELVRQLVELVFVDGRAELAERKLVERIAGSLGVQDEARKLIARRVDELMKQLMR